LAHPYPKLSAPELASVTEGIVSALARAKSAVILAGVLVRRTGLCGAVERLLEWSGLPFATMFMGKSVLDEQHPNYIGMYDGALLEPEVRELVESADHQPRCAADRLQ
jgi:indolepyruvate decarboxylase